MHANEVLWQGIHICGRYTCGQCGEAFVEDLPVGQALFTPYRVDSKGQLTGDDSAKSWFGNPLRDSLHRPAATDSIGFTVEIRRKVRHAIVLNCIDFLYGHCLLKLLNAEAHAGDRTKGLIVIVPRFLRWMIPEYVAEIWEVDLPLGRARSYFPQLHRCIVSELARFECVQISPAHSHPAEFNIVNFTTVPRHDFKLDNYRITFVWRDDRLWAGTGLLTRGLRKLGVHALLLRRQQRKVLELFSALKEFFPEARFTVIGSGRDSGFPDWIDDMRTRKFDSAIELKFCRAYAESRIVIGIHGSNMLLPSAHAGMSIDLMPAERWPNIGQDILYHQSDFGGDHRIAAFRHRYVPVEASPRIVQEMVVSMCRDFATTFEAFGL